MDSCTVHFIPAEAGDCLVLEFSNRDCIIIDGGYKSTYKNELKPLLIKLKEKGCKIILLIVTHIDQDHIEGAIELIKENGEATNPQIIEIENIWFNGFFNTLFMNDIFSERRKNVIEKKQKEKMRLVKAELNMQQRTGIPGNISARHSKQFEELCVEYGYSVNKQFFNHIVMRTSEDVDEVLSNKIKISDCFFTVLSPNKMLLDKLAKEFDKKMRKIFGAEYSLSDNKDFSSIFELLMELHCDNNDFSSNISAMGKNIERWIGTSTLAKMNDINNASIVVEIEYKHLRFLFTGDSDSYNWESYIKNEYDLIKFSHHGTTQPNIKLIEKSRSNHALISTNGRRNHPENDFLAQLILNGNKNLYFNYDIKQKQILLNCKEKYKFNIIFCQREIEIR